MIPMYGNIVGLAVWVREMRGRASQMAIWLASGHLLQDLAAVLFFCGCKAKVETEESTNCIGGRVRLEKNDSVTSHTFQE